MANSKLQNSDVKSQGLLESLGGSKSNLIHSDKIYDNSKSQDLNARVTGLYNDTNEIETNAENYIVNGDGDSGSLQNIVTNGAVTLTLEETEPLRGTGSFSLEFSADTQYVEYTVRILESYLYGKTGVLTWDSKLSLGQVEIQILNSSDAVIASKEINSGTNRMDLFFTFPSSSVKLRIKPKTGVSAASLVIDNIKLQKSRERYESYLGAPATNGEILYGSAGNIREWGQAPGGVNIVAAPTTNMSDGILPNTEITAVYRNAYSIPQASTDWLLSTNSDYSLPEIDETSTTDLTSKQVNLSPDTLYHFKLRQTDIEGNVSNYKEGSFTTANIYVDQPTITSPTEGATDIAEDPEYTSSVFQIVGDPIKPAAPLLLSPSDTATDVGATPTLQIDQLVLNKTIISVETPTPTSPLEGASISTDSPTLEASAFALDIYFPHLNTDWEIRKSSDNSLVHSSYDDSANLLSYTMPTGVLDPNTEYYVRCRYDGDMYGLSAWSLNRSFTTSTIFSVEAIATYNGVAGNDYFQGFTIDSSGNIFAVGYTNSEGQGGVDTLIVKYDSNLNKVAAKTYGGTSNEYFYGVTIDSSGNIFAVGVTTSEGQGSSDALIVKYDSNLNKVAAKTYGGASGDSFQEVTIDSSGNIFAVGYTLSEGQGGNDALIVKYDSNLNKLAAKIYGGTSNEYFYDVTIDSSGNIFAVGFTSSEGQGSGDALIVKYDSNLNKVAAKIYGGANYDYFQGVTADSSGNIFAVGVTTSEGQGSNDALIVKYDSNLNKLAAKTYGGASGDYFQEVTTDSSGALYAVGNTSSEGQGGNDAIIVKYDTSLNKISGQVYGGSGGSEYFREVTTDSSGNIYAIGYGYNPNNTTNQSILVKTTLDTVGTYPAISYYTVANSNLTEANSNLTVGNSSLTVANSNLTAATSNLTAANSTLTHTADALV